MCYLLSCFSFSPLTFCISFRLLTYFLAHLLFNISLFFYNFIPIYPYIDYIALIYRSIFLSSSNLHPSFALMLCLPFTSISLLLPSPPYFSSYCPLSHSLISVTSPVSLSPLPSLFSTPLFPLSFSTYLSFLSLSSTTIPLSSTLPHSCPFSSFPLSSHFSRKFHISFATTIPLSSAIFLTYLLRLFPSPFSFSLAYPCLPHFVVFIYTHPTPFL